MYIHSLAKHFIYQNDYQTFVLGVHHLEYTPLEFLKKFG